MANSKVSVELTVEEAKAIRSIARATKELEKFEETAVEAGQASDEAFKEVEKSSAGFAGSFKSLAGAVTLGNLAAQGISAVAGSIKDFVFESVAAAQEQENALNNLAQALRATGDFSQAAVDDFSAFASELQRASVYGDEVVIQQIAIAKSFGATNQQAKDLVQAAANLSATFGGDLESNVEKLGKALNGNVGKLGQYIPELKNLTKEQLNSGKAAEIINEKFTGAAAAQLDTYSGKVIALKNAYSDLQEEIGATITTSSTASGTTGILTKLFQELTQRMVDSRIATEAQSNGFVDSESKMNVLSERYSKLNAELEKYQKIVEEDKSKGLLESLFSFDNVPLAKEKIQSLSAELRTLEQQINTSASKIASVAAPEGAGSKQTGKNELSKEEQDALRKRVESEKIALAELQVSRDNFRLYEEEQRLAQVEINEQNYASELERLKLHEQEKIDAQFAIQEAKDAQIQDARLRQLAQEKTAQDKSLAQQKAYSDAEKNINQRRVQLQQQTQAAILGIVGATAQLGTALAKDGSKEQFLIQKAAAVAQTIISTNLAAAQALAVPPAPNVGLAAFAKAQGAISLAAILATAIKGYNDGGIVPGSSTSGDKVLARVNSREGIFTVNQQKQLFDMANGNGPAGDSIIDAINALGSRIQNMVISIQVDGREIARTVRDQKEAGFAI